VNSFLKVNKEKTKVGYIKGLKFLDYSFYVSKGVCKLSLHSKSKVKLRLKLKELTSRSKGFGYERSKNQAERIYPRLDKLL